MNKLAFINIPSQELERPPAAAAAISACAKSIGWDCQIFDFNLFLHSHVSTEVWQELELYWRHRVSELTIESNQELGRVLDLFLDKVCEYDPAMIGVSVFSKFSVSPAYVVLSAIRKKTKCTVVIGGYGTICSPGDGFNLGGPKDIPTFGAYAKHVGLTDYYVTGDADDSFKELLQGNTSYPGINGIPNVQIRDLNKLPIPDYTGIEPLSYYYTYQPGIYLTATKGCVRKCTFCNVPDLWPKFISRSAESVVDEIIDGKKRFGVNLFHFTDSLINGNMKVWREMNTRLIEAKKADASLEPIEIMGQFICRPKTEQNEQDWTLMSNAGVGLIVVGFESFSPNVRNHMGKHFSNDDIDFHIRQSALHGIKNIGLMFVGYPVETQEDHELNIEFLYKYQKYAKAGIMHMIRWGYTGMFSGDTSKIEKPGNVKIVTDPEFQKKFSNLPPGLRDIASGFGWINEFNPTLTLRERIRRRLELHELSVKLGWPMTRSLEELQILHNILHGLTQNKINTDDFESLANVLDFH